MASDSAAQVAAAGFAHLKKRSLEEIFGADHPGFRPMQQRVEDGDFDDLIERDEAEEIASENAEKCGFFRKIAATGREIKVINQRIAAGVKPPLSYRYQTFDTDTANDAISEDPGEPTADTYGACIVMAIDTEWQGRELSGRHFNEVLSYQIAARSSAGSTCEIIIHVREGDRLTLGELIEAARLNLGVKPKELAAGEVIVASHFGAAEWSAMDDRQDLAEILSLVRKVPVTLGAVKYKTEVNKRRAIIRLRMIDTYLLAPDGNQSLAKIGEVVGFQKIILPDGMIENMAALRDSDPELFELYGMRDAVVTLMYLDQVADMARRELGVDRLPLTVGGLSVSAYVSSLGDDYLDYFGLEKVREFKRTSIRQVETRQLSESMHELGFSGGLNTATPSRVVPEDGRVVVDIDFVSAYPCAMATIPVIDWSKGAMNGTETGMLPAGGGSFAQAISLSYVEFSFPPDCRRPCIPVDAGARGLIYPLTGTGYVTAAELQMARQKGAKIIVIRQEKMPYRTDQDGNAILLFADYLSDMIERRRAHEKGSLENLMFKLMANALYGKMAQGVKRRSVRAFASKSLLPPSRVTCPAYACAVTGTVRAALIALMDAIEEAGGVVHAATTDGCMASFPGSPDMIKSLHDVPGLVDAVMRKPAIRTMSMGAVNMGFDAFPLEVKAVGDGCEVWKTRGYVITHGEKVLHAARAGIQIKGSDEIAARRLKDIAANEDIVKSEVKSLASAQSIFDGQNEDLVSISTTRRTNLDFDFKLIPTGDGRYRPPINIDEFHEWRDVADNHRRQGLRATQTSVAMSVSSIQMRGGEAAAVKRQLMRAILQDVGGLRPEGMSDKEIAEALGLSADDAKNAKRRRFQKLPDTPEVRKILADLVTESGLELGRAIPLLLQQA